MPLPGAAQNRAYNAKVGVLPIVLRICYAMCGTDVGCAGTRQATRLCNGTMVPTSRCDLTMYAQCDFSYSHSGADRISTKVDMLLSPLYTMPSTDKAYDPTRLSRSCTGIRTSHSSNA
eukprot:1440744-Rhodomonas_salina.5